MSFAKRLLSLVSPISPLERLTTKVHVAALSNIARDAAKRLERSTATINALNEEVVSLRRGSTAGMHEAASAAFEEVIDTCRTKIGAYQDEKLEVAIERQLVERDRAREAATALRGEVHALKEQLATAERVGGVNGLARLTLHCDGREPLSAAAERVMRELADATKRADGHEAHLLVLEGERVTGATRIADLERDLAQATKELEETRTLADNLDAGGDALLMAGAATARRVDELEEEIAATRLERDKVVEARDEAIRKAHLLAIEVQGLRARGAA